MIKKLLLGLMAICSLAATAQDTLNIDTLLIFDGRTRGTLGQNISITRIDGKILQKAPVQSVEDYLDYLPWLDLRSRGSLGVQGDLSIRGGNYEQTLIMLDGVPMTDAQTGHHNLNLLLPPEMYGSMEISANGASRIYGPKAMAGAVNFTTRLPDRNSAFASVFGGENGFQRLAAGASGYYKGWGAGISGQTLSHSGFTTNTDMDQNSLFGQVYRKDKAGKIWMNAGIGNKRFGAQNFYSSRFPAQQEYTQTRLITVNWEYFWGKWQWVGNSYYRYNHDRFELFREGDGWYSKRDGLFIRGGDTAILSRPAGKPISYYRIHNYHQSIARGGMNNISRKFGAHAVSIGLEYRSEFVRSNVLGEPGDTLEVPFGSDGAKFTRSARRENWSVYLEDKVSWNNWVLSGGVLFNNNSAFGNGIFPGMEVSKILCNMRVFASANKGFRLPTYTDLYYNIGGAKGSKLLKPEEAVSYELGTQIRHKEHRFRLATFARDGKNLIDWVRFNGSNVDSAANLTQVFYYGADGYWEYMPKKPLAGVLQNITAGFFVMNADKKSEGFQSFYALDFIGQKYTLQADWKLHKNINLSTLGYLQKRMGGYKSPGSTTETAYPHALAMDVRLTATIKQLKFFAEATNVFDSPMMDLGNVQLPGRWLKAGLTLAVGQ
jgi:iron complex outermembrane receptor protein